MTDPMKIPPAPPPPSDPSEVRGSIGGRPRESSDDIPSRRGFLRAAAGTALAITGAAIAHETTQVDKPMDTPVLSSEDEAALRQSVLATIQTDMDAATQRGQMLSAEEIVARYEAGLEQAKADMLPHSQEAMTANKERRESQIQTRLGAMGGAAVGGAALGAGLLALTRNKTDGQSRG